MITVLKQYVSIMNMVNKILGWILALLLTLMTILISWQVFTRFIGGTPLTFSEEISRFLMIWMTLLGAAFAIQKGTLIAIELIPDIVSEKAGKFIRITANIISLFFYFILIKFGWDLATTFHYQKAPSTGISMFWPMAGIFVGGIFMFLNTLALISKEIIGEGE